MAVNSLVWRQAALRLAPGDARAVLEQSMQQALALLGPKTAFRQLFVYWADQYLFVPLGRLPVSRTEYVALHNLLLLATQAIRNRQFVARAEKGGLDEPYASAERDLRLEYFFADFAPDFLGDLNQAPVGAMFPQLYQLCAHLHREGLAQNLQIHQFLDHLRHFKAMILAGHFNLATELALYETGLIETSTTLESAKTRVDVKSVLKYLRALTLPGFLELSESEQTWVAEEALQRYRLCHDQRLWQIAGTLPVALLAALKPLESVVFAALLKSALNLNDRHRALQKIPGRYFPLGPVSIEGRVDITQVRAMVCRQNRLFVYDEKLDQIVELLPTHSGYRVGERYHLSQAVWTVDADGDVLFLDNHGARVANAPRDRYKIQWKSRDALEGQLKSARLSKDHAVLLLEQRSAAADENLNVFFILDRNSGHSQQIQIPAQVKLWCLGGDALYYYEPDEQTICRTDLGHAAPAQVWARVDTHLTALHVDALGHLVAANVARQLLSYGTDGHEIFRSQNLAWPHVDSLCDLADGDLLVASRTDSQIMRLALTEAESFSAQEQLLRTAVEAHLESGSASESVIAALRAALADRVPQDSLAHQHGVASVSALADTELFESARALKKAPWIELHDGLLTVTDKGRLRPLFVSHQQACHLCLTASGNAVFYDADTKEIVVVNSQEQLLSRYGLQGSDSGQLQAPQDIAQSGAKLAVLDAPARVHVLGERGQFYHSYDLKNAAETAPLKQLKLFDAPAGLVLLGNKADCSLQLYRDTGVLLQTLPLARQLSSIAEVLWSHATCLWVRDKDGQVVEIKFQAAQ